MLSTAKTFKTNCFIKIMLFVSIFSLITTEEMIYKDKKILLRKIEQSEEKEINENDIVEINKSNNGEYLKSNIIYALLLQKGKTYYGVYQEIELLNDIGNLCIFNNTVDDLNNITVQKESCKKYTKGNYEINITNTDIILEENQNFYTFIYFDDNSTENDIKLFYKHIIIKDDNSELKETITYNKDITYYPLLSSSTDNNYDLLFIQIIKSGNFTYTPISIKYTNEGSDTETKKLITFDFFDSKDEKIFGKIFKINFNKTQIYISITENDNILLLNELANSTLNTTFSFDYIDNVEITGVIDSNNSNKYNLFFDPFEKNGIADYYILPFKTSEYSLQDIENPLYIINNLEKITDKKILTEIKSESSNFDDETKKQFNMEFSDLENNVYYMTILAIKKNPVSYKLYTPIQTEKIEIINENYTFENFNEKTVCYNYTLTKNKKLIINFKKNENGLLIIQSQNFSTIIYNNEELSNDNSLKKLVNDEFSYAFNSSKADDEFEMSYIPNEEKNSQKICLEFIPFKGKNDIKNSKIEYKIYNTYVTIPYFFNNNDKKNYELFKISYNNNSIPKIAINYNNKDYSKYLKSIENSFYYFGFYNPNNVSESNNNNLIEVSLTKKNSNEAIFTLEREEINDWTLVENTNNITINNTPQFYFIDLNKKLNSFSSLLFYSNLLSNSGFNLYKGNYFESENELQKIDKNLYSINKNDNLTLLTIILHSNTESNGFIDIQSSEEIFYTKNCDRLVEYNKELILNNTDGNYYIICHYDSNTNKRIKFKYEREISEKNTLDIYYTNKITKKNNITEIINDFFNKNINNKKKTIFVGNIEIFGYKYEIKDEKSIKLVLKSEEYLGPDEEYSEEESNLALIIALVFIGINVLIIIFFFICKSHNKGTQSDDIEKNIGSVNNPLVNVD